MNDPSPERIISVPTPVDPAAKGAITLIEQITFYLTQNRPQLWNELPPELIRLQETRDFTAQEMAELDRELQRKGRVR